MLDKNRWLMKKGDDDADNDETLNDSLARLQME